MLRRFDLDEEDLDLLRAEGVKSPNDFRRIKSVDRLNLPSGPWVCLRRVTVARLLRVGLVRVHAKGHARPQLGDRHLWALSQCPPSRSYARKGP